jgi:hypothetical protein
MVDGKQYIVVAAGSSLFAFRLKEFLFKLADIFRSIV